MEQKEELAQNLLEVLHVDDSSFLQEMPVLENDGMKIPWGRLTSLGGGFESLVAGIQEIIKKEGGSGFYYVNTHGKNMFAAKSGNGFIGSLKDELGKVGGGQANMISLAVQPEVLCMAASLAAIDRKLDRIQEQQKEIFDFLLSQEEAKIRGNIQTLVDVLENYRYNWDNETYKLNKHILVQDIRRDAEQEIILHSGTVEKLLARKGIFHSDQEVKATAQKLQKSLQNYQLAVYQYAYAAFLEVLLLENFGEKYLTHASEKVREYAYRYRESYTECYDHLKCLSEGSIQTQMAHGLSAISMGIGAVLSKTPVLNKGTVDAGLLNAGERFQETAVAKTEKVMRGLIGSADSGTAIFTENIDKLNRIWNKPKEIWFDEKAVYFMPQAV